MDRQYPLLELSDEGAIDEDIMDDDRDEVDVDADIKGEDESICGEVDDVAEKWCIGEVVAPVTSECSALSLLRAIFEKRWLLAMSLGSCRNLNGY